MPIAFTLRIEESALASLDRLAENTERSRNWPVARAIEDYVALNVWRIGRIEAAADRGEFVSDEDIARLRVKFANAA